MGHRVCCQPGPFRAYCFGMTSERGTSAEAPGGGRGSQNFEQMLEQIESIVERIERGEVGLEQALAEHERGVRMIRACREILHKAEQRVEMLNKDLERSEQGLPRQDDDDDAGGAGSDEPAPF